MDTKRTTADLPNIPNIFAPMPPELSPAGLNFQCDAKHSCDDDHLVANYYGFYATDQMDLTDKWKLRVGVRQDCCETVLNPLITVPGRFTTTGVPLVAGVPERRNNAPVSWNIGTLYKVSPASRPISGYRRATFRISIRKTPLTASARRNQRCNTRPASSSRVRRQGRAEHVGVQHLARQRRHTVQQQPRSDNVVFDSQLTNGVEARWMPRSPTVAPARQRDRIRSCHHRAPQGQRQSAIIRRACRPIWPTCGPPTNSRSAAFRDSRSAAGQLPRQDL